MTVTADTLNSVMEFDHVIQVHDDGTVTEPTNVYGPDHIWQETDSEGSCIDDVVHGLEGWSVMTGYTGQYGYNGPVMHTSEYIGGGMARDILSTPRLYVALVVNDSDGDSFGWAVAYKDA